MVAKEEVEGSISVSSLGSLANRVAAAVWILGVLCWLLLTGGGGPTPFLPTTSERYILTAVRMTTEKSAFIRDNVPLGRRKKGRILRVHPPLAFSWVPV